MKKLKHALKGSKAICDAYVWANRRYLSILVDFFPVSASKYFYRKRTGKLLDLDDPKDFNEKLQWLKHYWQHPLVARCADKYAVRSYAAELGCSEILNEVYGVYKDPAEIKWEQLPSKFALKTTHACGTNIICDDKSSLSKKDAIRKLRKWLRTDYSHVAAELHYKRIERRIIAEKYIETPAGFLPNDYKVYCFNGVARLILVATDRATDMRLNFLSLDWERLDIVSSIHNRGEIPARPSCLSEMIHYAEKLAAPFPFVRVDFYDNGGKPILGEMTFTPSACAATRHNDIGLKLLGEMLHLPPVYQESGSPKPLLAVGSRAQF